MKPSNADNERRKLEEQVGFHKKLNGGLLALSVLLVGALLWSMFNAVTHILPPEVRRPYELGANYANKDYFADMAGYTLGMVLTVTPETVDYNNKVILKMTDPDGYGQLKANLDAAALRLKRDRVSTVWVPRKEVVSERDKRVTASGRLKTYIADVLTSERDKDYLIEFNVTTSGRLYVLKIEEIVKPDPKPSPAVAQQSG